MTKRPVKRKPREWWCIIDSPDDRYPMMFSDYEDALLQFGDYVAASPHAKLIRVREVVAREKGKKR